MFMRKNRRFTEHALETGNFNLLPEIPLPKTVIAEAQETYNCWREKARIHRNGRLKFETCCTGDITLQHEQCFPYHNVAGSAYHFSLCCAPEIVRRTMTYKKRGFALTELSTGNIEAQEKVVVER